MKPVPVHIQAAPPVQIAQLSTLLRAFREQLERDAEAPVANIDLNAALMLDDLCAFLGFSTELRTSVVGESFATVQVFLDSCVSIAPELGRCA